MNRNRIIGLARLFRFELPIAAGVCVILGEMLALGSLPSFGLASAGFVSIFCLSATALILNDYFDIEIDRINSPERPLPSGIVGKKDVIVLSVVVALLGFIAAAMIGLNALIAGIIVWIVGFLYNWRFKRAGFIGNVMVCFSVGMTFVFGGIAADRISEPLIWFFGVMVMLFDLGEEIAADVMDVEGDRLAGSRSLAVILGPANAMRISASVFTVVLIITFLPFLLERLEWVFFIPLALMDAAIIVSVIRLLDPRTKNLRFLIRTMYLSGLAAILLFIAMRVVLS